MTKKNKRGGGRNIQATVFKWIRIGALVAPGIGQAIRWKDAGAEAIIDQIIRVYTGYDVMSGRFEWSWLAEGYMPYLASVLATIGVPKVTAILRRL